MRGRFDVTGKLIAGGANALAVRIEKMLRPAVPNKRRLKAQADGGAPGADNPTYHASIGWDSIPTIRGRNTGIWGDVYLTRNRRGDNRKCVCFDQATSTRICRSPMSRSKQIW